MDEKTFDQGTPPDGNGEGGSSSSSSVTWSGAIEITAATT